MAIAANRFLGRICPFTVMGILSPECSWLIADGSYLRARAKADQESWDLNLDF